MECRSPREDELKLIDFLVEKSGQEELAAQLDGIVVEPMNDGGMGGLVLMPKCVSKNYKERQFGSSVSEHIFDDSDGIAVIATLYLDSDGCLYELDMWKVNYSKIVRFPEIVK